MHSPFLYSRPVPPERFVGRRRELEMVLDRIAHGGQSTVVLGEPRAGKTSLLHYVCSPRGQSDLAARGGDYDHILFSPLDAHIFDHGIDDATFWEHALEPVGDLDNPIFADDTTIQHALRACRDSGYQPVKIRSLLRALRTRGARLVILVDEFDYLLQRCVASPETFFARIRSLVTHASGALALLLASRVPLETLGEIAQGARVAGSPVFHFLTEEHLGPLSQGEVRTVLSAAEERFSAEDTDFVIDISGGHPYLVQLVGDVLWHAYQDGHPDSATRWEDASARALRGAGRVLGEIWRQWSSAQRFVMASAAAGQLGAEGLVTPSQFMTEIDTLLVQGFLVERGTRLEIGSRLFATWCTRELCSKGRASDPWTAWVRHEQRDVPIPLSDQRTWIQAIRAALGEGADASQGSLPFPRGAASVGPRRFKVFVAYAQEDSRYRDQLEGHLTPLVRAGIIEIWHDRRIAAGEDWQVRLKEEMDSADVILLLISADFIASDFCWDEQVIRAIERHREGTARVIPISVRPADWERLPFATLEALPSDERAVSRWSNTDEAWLDVAAGIRALLEPPSP
jgi:hypothetical protein